jgi:hypothetical protein
MIEVRQLGLVIAGLKESLKSSSFNKVKVRLIYFRPYLGQLLSKLWF